MTTGTNLNDLYHEKDLAKIERHKTQSLATGMKRTGRVIIGSVGLVFLVTVLAGSTVGVALSAIVLLIVAVAAPVINMAMTSAVGVEDSEINKIDAKINRDLLG